MERDAIVKRIILAALVMVTLLAIGCTATVQTPEPVVKVKYVPVSIGSAPENAEIYIAGKLIGTTPLEYRLTPGTHTIELRVPGFKPWSRELAVMEGNPTRIMAYLEKE